MIIVAFYDIIKEGGGNMKKIISGNDVNDVFDNILVEYAYGVNEELLFYLEKIRTPDLTIQQSFELYTKLRYHIDGNVVLRIAEKEVFDESNNVTYALDYWRRNTGTIYGD